MNARANLPEGTVTFVFTDIEGSTRLLTALGNQYPELLSRHHAVLRRQIGAHGGTEVKTEGDAFFAVFNRPLDAISFATDSQRELGATRWPGGAHVRVRMGIHTGEGTLSEGDYVGLDVHRAARVAAAGSGGQVLVSGPAAALVGSPPLPGVVLRDLGDHRLKDLPQPLRAIARVLGIKEEPARPQIDTLAEALAQRRALIVLDSFEQGCPSRTIARVTPPACSAPWSSCRIAANRSWLRAR